MMPYKRGCAAIGEMLEKTIYKVLGFTCRYTGEGKDSPDVAAIAALNYAQYLDDYNRLVQIERIAEGAE